MNQNYDLEDRLLNYSARIFREEKSFLNPLALGLRGWKLDVECWKFASAGRKVSCAGNKIRSVLGSASLGFERTTNWVCPGGILATLEFEPAWHRWSNRR
jgi:hypothetical protein